MDMYSFGMVCLWALFRDPLLEYLKNCSLLEENLSEETMFFHSNEAPQSTLESLQTSDELAFVVETILKKSSFLNDSQQNNLTKFFHALLCKDKVTRQSDWRQLLQLVTYQGEEGTFELSRLAGYAAPGTNWQFLSSTFTRAITRA